MRNAIADVLSNATARMTSLRDIFYVENLYKSSIHDNITNLHIFDDDE